MPGCIRPSKKGRKIAYRLLKTPKDRQQESRPPSEKVKREWYSDVANTQ